MKLKRMLSALLMTTMLAGLTVGCGGTADPTPTPAPTPTPVATPTPAPTPAPTPTPAPKAEVNFAVMTGPTGVGAAKLLNDNEAGTTANQYNVTVAAANDELTGKLMSGDLDIAALATNVAANLYNKSNGKIQIAALNTLGVLYVLENGSTVNSISDLKGKTLYTTGQGANPEFVLNYLLKQNGLDPQKDLTIVFKTAEEVNALMVSGEAKLCMMPVPAVTAIQMKNPDVRTALNITKEWESIADQGSLTMGSIVVRTEFAKEHPDVVNAFLQEYAASIDYVKNNPAEASEMVAKFGITANAKIAANAIPACNLVCITGENVRDSAADYFEMLFAANPNAIGGAIPDDAFYYIP